MANLIRSLKESYPEREIISNRGFSVLESISGSIDGIMVESLFQTFDFKTQQYQATPEADTRYILNQLKTATDAGLEVYILDYVDPILRDLALRTSDRIEQLGFQALVSTPDLQGSIAAPIRRFSRNILVLYGGDPNKDLRANKWPIDTFAFTSLQTSLEWLGYEVEFHNAFISPPPRKLDSRFSAIITDRYLEIPLSRQGEYVDWLIQQKEKGIKLIITGYLPFDDSHVKRRFLKALGVTGSENLITDVVQQKWGVLDEDYMNYEAEVRFSLFNNLDLQAPADSRILLSVLNETRDGRTFRYDPLFIAPWGGFLLDPYLIFLRPDALEFWCLDPFKYLRQALDIHDFPIPDTTTRDGVRLFASHVDGDGFSSIS
ncbi:MAG TPA: hypothetical protein EYQ50_07265 [Verrucomicrobiales bacterium]|nr:hypothetical protein [Verrucomicrobiales bacterium]